MRNFIIGCFCFLLILTIAYFYIDNKNTLRQEEIDIALKLEEQQEIDKKLLEERIAFEKIKMQADSVKIYCTEKNLRLDYCILVDFKIHSGKNRLFVWDFEKDTIVDAAVCCHGVGNKENRNTPSKPKFSNKVGSFCSSLGYYKIAYRDKCSWGTGFQYRLHGLDATNNRALERAVTLHSYGLVPDEEIYPNHIPLGYSQGCFIVSDNMLHRLDKILKGYTKPLVIKAYYS